jgi:hypothetical protein
MVIPPRRSSAPSIKSGGKLSQSFQRYLQKDIEEYNTHDLVFYFSQAYEKAKGVPYFFSLAADAAKLKRLTTALDNYSIVKLIDFVVVQKDDISIGMISSSWVNTFIKEADIKHPELSKYEVMITTPFLTDREQECVKLWLERVLIAYEEGDANKAQQYLLKLSKAWEETKRRKALLTAEVV